LCLYGLCTILVQWSDGASHLSPLPFYGRDRGRRALLGRLSSEQVRSGCYRHSTSVFGLLKFGVNVYAKVVPNVKVSDTDGHHRNPANYWTRAKRTMSRFNPVHAAHFHLFPRNASGVLV